MTSPKIGFSPVEAIILILLISSIVLGSAIEIARAGGYVKVSSCHLDRTGKICGVFLRPGVRDEFKSTSTVAWSHTLDTLRGAQGGEAQRQQIMRRYQDYAILASMSDSVGDFQFDIWVVQPISDIRIYVPSNFTFAYTSSGYGEATTADKLYSVWTDITNDYSYVSVYSLEVDNPIAPGWDVVEVGRIPITTPPIPSFNIIPGLYHVRLLHMRAPATSGLYHFKIYVDGVSIGAGNYPITIVRGDLNPAYVTGIVRLRGLAASVLVSGRVTATGTTSLGRYAEAVGYFGPQDFERADADASYYRYWLFGLPGGTFELTASASGFLRTSSRVMVNPGQSLSSDFELEKGTEIRVKIWSKNENGPIPWGNLWQLPYGTNDPYLPITDQGPHRDILVRLFDEYDESLGYWASDDIAAPYGPPWTPATIDGRRQYSPLILKPSTIPSSISYTTALTDSRGLPSIRLDGHVPSDAADLIEGVGEGFYRLEIQVTGYVMKESDDWQRILTISSARGVYSFETDLGRSSWIMASGIVSDSLFAPVSSPTLVIVAKSTDGFERALAAGRFPAGVDRFTMVLEGFNGLYNYNRVSTDYQDYGLEPIDYSLEVYMADLAAPYLGNPGIGWYLVEEAALEVHLLLGSNPFLISFHLEPCSITFILRSIRVQEPTELSPWTFPGAGIRLYLIDEEGSVSAVLDPILYGLVQDDGRIAGDPYDIDTSPPGWHGLLSVLFTGIDRGPIAALGGIYPTRIEEGKYFVSVATLGYIQRQDSYLHVRPGVRNDLQVDLVQGAHIRVELDFGHEYRPTRFNGFARVEVYNQEGTLVGASIYAGADPNPNLRYLLYDSTTDWKIVPGASEGAGTGAQPQRAFLSRLYYEIPPVTWAHWPAMIRSDANRLSTPQGARVVFDVFGFHWYQGGPDSRIEKLWADGWETTNGNWHPDSGIRGSRDVLDLEGWGNFTVRVWAFDPYGPDGIFDSNGPDGVFGTNDDYTSPDVIDGGLSDFRSYAHAKDFASIQAPWGGTTTIHVTLDELPSILGTVSSMDMFGNQRTLAWAQVIDNYDAVWASTTGSYRLWLPEGSHKLLVTTIVEEQLWEPFYFEITLPISGSHIFRDVVLTMTQGAVPEFVDPILSTVIMVTALLLTLSRRRSKKRHKRIMA